MLNETRPCINLRDIQPTQGPLQEIIHEEVERQLRKSKNNKSCGPDGIPVEAFKHLGRWGVSQLTNIFNDIMHSGMMPGVRRESILTPSYTDKGNHMNCSNFTGIKLLTHVMKLWEHIIDQTLRDIVSISDGQFDFRPGVGTTDAIFIIRTVCEKYSAERERERVIERERGRER